MAYIPGYTYDIFISYSHVDNATVSNQGPGWIEQFYMNLNLYLSKRIGKMDVVKIWWDSRKLDGSILFDQSIEEGIRQSAIMISLMSPAYLSSDYCKKELDLFSKKAMAESLGPKIGDRSRLLNILLNNIPFTEWPAEFSGTTGFPFHDSSSKEELGDPLDTANPMFSTQLKTLRDSIMNLFGDFMKMNSAAPVSVADPVREGPVLYFGEVADTLRAIRKRTMEELEKNGFNLISGIPPPDEPAAHESKVSESLAKADLSIHLLDAYPGKEIPGATDEWYPAVQAELALKHAKSTLLWVPSELDLNSVEEVGYRQFLQGLEAGRSSTGKYDYVRGSKSTLTQQIMDLAGQLKSTQPGKPAKGQVSVLLDTHFTDQLGAMDLGRILLENQIQPFINPQEDDPKKNINILADRISQVSKLIFYYGKVSRDWVLERMSAALQLIVANNFPVEEFYIFLAPPNKDPGDISLKQRFLKVSVIDHSGDSPANANALQSLVNSLKGGSI